MIDNSTNEIFILSILPPEKTLGNHVHIEDYIYSTEGICRTCCARDYKDPIRIVVVEEDYDY